MPRVEDDGRSLTYFCDNRRHLVCQPYSVLNLHIMAARLKLSKNWYHGRSRRGQGAHYDIPVRRIKEIGDLCIRLTSRDIIGICGETHG